MKTIRRDTDYAVRALNYIAEKDRERVSVSELVKNLKIPRPFLRKILQVLNKKGVLRSYKGKNGGFQLMLAPDEIFLSRIIEIFQGRLESNSCFLGKSPCPNRKFCKFKKRLNEIEGYVSSQFHRMTIKDLIG